MIRLAVLDLFAASTVFASDHQLKPVRIAVPVDGHIHPAACVTRSGTIVVTYGASESRGPAHHSIVGRRNDMVQTCSVRPYYQ